jgi:hypothetical protein
MEITNILSYSTCPKLFNASNVRHISSTIIMSIKCFGAGLTSSKNVYIIIQLRHELQMWYLPQVVWSQ